MQGGVAVAHHLLLSEARAVCTCTLTLIVTLYQYNELYFTYEYIYK